MNCSMSNNPEPCARTTPSASTVPATRPPATSADRIIEVRYNRANPERIIVYYKGERMGEATRLDFLANDGPPSKHQIATQPDAITPAKPFENQ